MEHSFDDGPVHRASTMIGCTDALYEEKIVSEEIGMLGVPDISCQRQAYYSSRTAFYDHRLGLSAEEDARARGPPNLNIGVTLGTVFRAILSPLLNIRGCGRYTL